MGRFFQLGELQNAIMNLLWAKKEASSAQVHQALYAERGLAPTTIATMLSKMEKKGLVTHRVDGRQYIYRATASQSEVQRSLVGELLERAFQGDAAALVNHLLQEGEIDAQELAHLKKLIQAKEEEGNRD